MCLNGKGRMDISTGIWMETGVSTGAFLGYICMSSAPVHAKLIWSNDGKRIYIFASLFLNSLSKNPHLAVLQVYRTNVLRTTSKYFCTCITGFLGRVTDICWSAGNLQIWGLGNTHQNSGNPGKIVGQCKIRNYLSAIVQIMGVGDHGNVIHLLLYS